MTTEGLGATPEFHHGLLGAGHGYPDEPLMSAVQFNREVIRILQKKCLACHARGTLAMSLSSYQDARLWGRAMREDILERRMPPWPAAGGYGSFANDISLTPRELTLMLSWLDGGFPRGNEADRPPAISSAAPARPPDLRIELPPQTLEPGDDLEVRRITVPTGLKASRSIGAVSFTPGDRRVVRSAFVSRQAGRSRTWIGAWTPWQGVTTLPGEAAHPLPQGSSLIVEVHYQRLEERATDRSVVGLYFSGQQPRAETVDLTVTTARAEGSGRLRARGEVLVSEDSAVWAMRPEVSDAAQSLEVSAVGADGRVQVLLWIPSYPEDWPIPYVFREPVRLARGTKVRVTAYFTRPDSATVTLALLRPSQVK